MANLAIQGHATRGKEVIEILEMLGGKNVIEYNGTSIRSYYFLDNNIICSSYDSVKAPGIDYYTIEEFLEKFPYRVGDRVLLKGVVKTIKQVCWDNAVNEVIYKLETNIRGFSEEYYVHHYDLQPYKEETMEEIKVDIPKGYEFAGVDDDKQQVVFTKIEILSQYPKTYEECARLLNTYCGSIGGYNWKLLSYFQQLSICRDAYWKIAGEQMGLGKPWEPDWENTETDKYVIEIVKNTITIHGYPWNETNHLLAFPTKEMRDAFYENFKDLIEQCKVLL